MALVGNYKGYGDSELLECFTEMVRIYGGRKQSNQTVGCGMWCCVDDGVGLLASMGVWKALGTGSTEEMV